MEKTTKLLIAAVSAILIFAVLWFLFKVDEGGISGIEALKLLDYGFWIPVAICVALSGVAVWFAAKKAKSDGAILAAVIIAAALFFSPWGKACTVKSDPTQAPKYQPK